MFNKKLKKNINELDVRIGNLYGELNKASTNDERNAILDQAKSLADLRDKLSEAKTRESVIPIVVPAVTGISALLLVLYYEKTGIITSKGMTFVTKMFRG